MLDVNLCEHVRLQRLHIRPDEDGTWPSLFAAHQRSPPLQNFHLSSTHILKSPTVSNRTQRQESPPKNSSSDIVLAF
jgi:hypothetical protein